jgi:FkbM family methyltransferase
MGGQIFFRGSYSGDQLNLVERLLRADSVFVDVGANQGEFSIAAADIARQGRVIAFEPVCEYRERLLDNVRINNFANIEVVSVALGETEGSLPIYDQPEKFSDGTRHEGLTTLFASDTRREVRELVAVKRLDDVVRELGIARVDVIKLDIEGAEWIALRGALDTLERCRPTLILEVGRETCRAAGYEQEAFVEWLTNLNYRLEEILDGGKTVPVTPTSLGAGIDGRVFLPGRVGNMADWYAHADLYVMSSRYEGFGNTLAEALVYGLPVVSFDCDTGPRDIVRHEVDGLLVPPGDVSNLAAALDRLMGDAELRGRFAMRAVDARTRFSIDRIAAMWELLFEAVSRDSR